MRPNKKRQSFASREFAPNVAVAFALNHHASGEEMGQHISMRLPRRTILKVGASAIVGASIYFSAARAQPAPKTYPLAASSLVLDVAAAGDALIAVGDRGFILRSTDAGQTWAQVASPTDVMLTGVVMTSAMNGVAIGHDATVLRTTDGGTTWAIKAQEPELEAPLLDVWFENEQRGLAVGAYGLIKETTDSGETWADRRMSDDEPHIYALVRAADGSLFAAGEAGAMFRSEDAGVTWAPVESSPYDGTYFGMLSLLDGALLAFGLQGNLYRSRDLAKTWDEIATGTTASLLGGIQRRDGSIDIVGLSGAVLTSIDGISFQTQNLPDREALSGVFETSAQKLIVFGERGLRALDTEALK
jgi:photosystem II stability/assembly factor-like uncharacterized protein